MPSIINALTASGGGVAITGDATGNLALQTAGNTAMTINTSQNVGIGTSTPANNLQVYRNASAAVIAVQNQTNDLQFQVNDGVASGAGVIYLSGAYPLTFWTNGSERVRINSTGGVSIGATTAVATLTVNGNITPSAAPNTNWGIDFAPTTATGSFVTIANDATYDLASGSGLVYVYDNAGNGVAQYFAFFGSVAVTNITGGFFSAVINTAGKVNFYYESGVARYRFQNKTGSTVNLFISTIRLRASA